ncbi:methionyl-tRNA formyltransferase [Pseudosulfitobacter sp. SM2401]|uniref:methionyl-tRNA formyltransferase n=1 Tax=Pseudosulfitobacter sp. SM2401 TaxID=3350098 RepID=UPI0036F3034E
MRIIFMGTPEFSVPVLNALVDAGHDIICVYSQPPRPAGRGKKDRLTPVHVRALELDLEVRHPVSLKTDEALAQFQALNADVAVVVAYGLILPQSVLDAPSRGCLNIHASLLPRWRGAAPIHRSIMAGDAQTGVCIMQMEAGLDTGPVLSCKPLEIGSQETTAQLHDRLSALGATAIVEALDQLGTVTPQAQSSEGVTYAAKIDKSEAAIDWSRSALDIDRQIRGLSSFPGAWFELDGTRVKVLGSTLVAAQGTAGVTLDDALCVACGDGAVRLTKLQRAGKGAQDADVFLRGNPVPKGTQL